MLHNDISNMSGYTVAFRFEDNIYTKNLDSIVQNIKNRFIPINHQNLNTTVVNLMSHLYRDTPYNVDIVIQREHYTNNIKDFINSLPCSRVVLIDKEVQIAQRLRMGDIHIYVDSDLNRLSLANSSYAVLPENLNLILRRYTK